MGFPVLDTEDFFNKSQSGKHTLVDARSESEFAHAHIPGAINIPILNDEERKLVGTEYKTNGRETAVLLGFKLVGPRFHQIIKEAQSAASSNNLLIYCWRGGMRSQILSWLLSLNGFRIELLKGGYKSFRNLVINTNASKRSYIVLGGPTGSGKTEVLNHLPIHGEQILDLEYLANHKGSAFGGLGKSGQPSNEQFENLIGIHLMKMKNENVIWIENESRSIGKCIIPEGLYTQIRESVVFTMDVPIHIRRNRIKNE
jgi:tRNA 2-selenouridine synthase